VQDQEGVERDQLEPSVERIRHAAALVEGRRACAVDDGEIDGMGRAPFRGAADEAGD
jgi:hypothetical protein